MSRAKLFLHKILDEHCVSVKVLERTSKINVMWRVHLTSPSAYIFLRLEGCSRTIQNAPIGHFGQLNLIQILITDARTQIMDYFKLLKSLMSFNDVDSHLKC